MIEGYTGWATHVNRIILSQTTISVGNDATISDDIESGGKRTYLKGSFCPDKFSVVMEFNADFNVKYTDSDGVEKELNKTEYQLFMEWYKNQHKYGSVPFEFPSITYSPQSGIVSNDYGNKLVEYYKITSAIECAKVGHCIQVKMTWETVFGGAVNVTEDIPEVKNITDSSSEFIEITFSKISNTSPVSSDFTLYINDEVTSLEGFSYDGNYKVRLYFTLESGSHNVSFSISDYSGLTVNNGDYSVTIEVD